jgi:hypothetical protein
MTTLGISEKAFLKAYAEHQTSYDTLPPLVKCRRISAASTRHAETSRSAWSDSGRASSQLQGHFGS